MPPATSDSVTISPRINTPPITPITGTTYPMSDAVVADASREALRNARKGRTVDTVAR